MLLYIYYHSETNMAYFLLRSKSALMYIVDNIEGAALPYIYITSPTFEKRQLQNVEQIQ